MSTVIRGLAQAAPPPASIAATGKAPTLRDYQARGVAELRQRFGAGVSHLCYQSPTGSGKTVLFAFIVAGAVKRGNKVLILGHRDEIIIQIDEALTALGVAHGIIAAGYEPTPGAAVQIANVATLVRRLDEAETPDLIVVDEAHHSVVGTWRKILAHWPHAKVLGVTATPERLDGKGLIDIYDELVIGPTVGELIPKYLSPFTTFAPERTPDLSGVRTRAGDFAVDQLGAAMSKGIVVDGAVDEYQRLCPGVATIVFCVDIAHSKLVAERFAARGFRSAHVDSDTPTDERRDLIAALGTGKVQVLCNCGLISEGLDVPSVVAVILLRPTKSLALYLQQVGRALRPAEGKQKALILDCAGNTLRFGLVDAPRQWSLQGRPKTEGAAPLCRCENCGALNPIAAFRCQNCGAQLREPPSRREIHTAPLIEVTLANMNYYELLRWCGGDIARLRLAARARGYHHGWVHHILRERAES